MPKRRAMRAVSRCVARTALMMASQDEREHQMTKFANVRFYETIMTEGDMCDYLRLLGDLEAMQRVTVRRPWNGKALRSAMKIKAKQIAVLEARYA